MERNSSENHTRVHEDLFVMDVESTVHPLKWQYSVFPLELQFLKFTACNVHYAGFLNFVSFLAVDAFIAQNSSTYTHDSISEREWIMRIKPVTKFLNIDIVSHPSRGCCINVLICRVKRYTT